MIGFGRCQVFFCSLDGGFDFSALHVFDRRRLFGHHGTTIAGNLGKAAVHIDPTGLVAFIVNFKNARPHGRDHRLVTDQDTEIALGAGNNNHLNIFRNQKAFRRYQFKGDLVGHNIIPSTELRGFAGHGFGLFDGVVDGADHVEGVFGQVVVITGANFLEAADRVF